MAAETIGPTKNDTKNSSNRVLHEFSLLSDDDIYLFNEGNHFRLYQKLGAHVISRNNRQGVNFALWAPNAEHVSVIGNFNDWDKDSHRLHPRENSGIWEGFIPGMDSGAVYKYHIRSRYDGYHADKADPFGFHTELSPQTASVVWDIGYDWKDADWMNYRELHNSREAAISIYEMHLGSWRRVPEEDNRPMNYRETAKYLVDYLLKTGFTHVEFLPVMEHPFYGSWGYQCLGYFAPTSQIGRAHV